MLAGVFAKSMRDRWITTLVAVLAVAIMLLGGMALYRGVDLSLYYDLPAAVLELMGIVVGGGAGGLSFGAVYGTVGALTLAGVAISIGSGSIAGEESKGTLGLLLANPTSRTHVLVSKASSLTALIAAGGAGLWLAALVIPGLLDVDTPGLHVGALVVAMTIVALFFGFLALAVGAWTGNDSAASGASAAVMAVSFVAASVLPLISGASWLAKVFPWYYYSAGEPLYQGAQLGHLTVLLISTVVLGVVATVGVNRRDLRDGTGAASIVDRLRANRVTRKVMDRIAGSARVSSIAVKTASEHQGLLVIACAIIFYVAILEGPLYTLIDDALSDFAASVPDALIALVGGADMSSPEGWIQTEVFSIMVPAALITATVVLGASAVAGEEQKRTMGLLLANPISRARVVAEKAAAIVAYGGIVGLAAFAGTLGGSLIARLGISVTGIASASVLGTLLGLVYGALALAVGAATGRTQAAVLTSAVAALVSYLAASFLPVNETTAAWAKISPFHYFLSSDPLVNGMNWTHACVLTALFLGLVAISVPLFRRRDLVG